MLIDSAPFNGNEPRDQDDLIAGAGQDIGKATAILLVQLGARVVIAKINDTSEEAKRE